MKAVEIIQQTL